LIAHAADETLQEISWATLKAGGTLLGGEIVSDESLKSDVLELTNDKTETLTLTFLKLDAAGITADHYHLSGRVRYENVSGKAHLVMRSYFPDGRAFFSRNLGESGPLRHLEGTADWRPFTLPFDATGTKMHPSALDLTVVFPGTGKVWISDLKLVQVALTPAEAAAAAPKAAWWDEQTDGKIGGWLGGVAGCIGALIGVLAGLRRNRTLVLALLKGMTIAGIVLVVAGIVAKALHQPYSDYYPLLLPGFIVAAVCGSNIAVVRKRYEDLELRRIQAMDA